MGLPCQFNLRTNPLAFRREYVRDSIGRFAPVYGGDFEDFDTEAKTAVFLSGEHGDTNILDMDGERFEITPSDPPWPVVTELSGDKQFDDTVLDTPVGVTVGVKVHTSQYDDSATSSGTAADIFETLIGNQPPTPLARELVEDVGTWKHLGTVSHLPEMQKYLAGNVMGKDSIFDSAADAVRHLEQIDDETSGTPPRHPLMGRPKPMRPRQPQQ